MTASIVDSDVIIARNPATDAQIGEFAATPADAVTRNCEGLLGRSAAWSERTLNERRRGLRAWASIISRDAEEWATLISAEIGKPRVEAMVEVVTTLDAIAWTIKHARRELRARRAGPGWQRLLLMGAARVEMRALGLVGLIGTWNYPLLLNAAPIAQALAAGNAVIWKPSELATACGERLHRGLVEAGIAPDYADTVFGGPEVGQALIDGPLDKALFTGGIGVGRKILEALGARGIPAVAELSGFDPAIVLPDAPIEATAKALAWAAFVGAGQTCVAVKRVFVVGDPQPLTDLLSEAARAIRVGDPSANYVDMGPLISKQARDRFAASVAAAVGEGARVVAGGRVLEGAGAFHEPTVLVAETAAAEQALAGVFGPVVIVRGVADVGSAIVAANAGDYGLAASVWGRDRGTLRQVSARLKVGMVTINDAVAPGGHASAPFGGVKASGFGHTRGAFGLAEFVAPCAVHTRGAGGWRPQLFPYRDDLMRMLRAYRALVHRAARSR